MANLRQRPLIFKWRHFEPHIIFCAIGWYLRFSQSYRDVQELLTVRGVEVDHSSFHDLAVDPTVCSGAEPALAATSETDQPILASRRNLRARERPLVLSITRHRLPGGDD